MLRTTVSGRPLPDAIESARSRLGAPDVLRLPLSEATGRTRRMTGIAYSRRNAGGRAATWLQARRRFSHTHVFPLLRSPVFPSQSKSKVHVGKVVQQGSSEEGIRRSRNASIRSNYLLVLSKNVPTYEMVSHTDSTSASHWVLMPYVLQAGVYRRIEAGPWPHI